MLTCFILQLGSPLLSKSILPWLATSAHFPKSQNNRQNFIITHIKLNSSLLFNIFIVRQFLVNQTSDKRILPIATSNLSRTSTLMQRHFRDHTLSLQEDGVVGWQRVFVGIMKYFKHILMGQKVFSYVLFQQFYFLSFGSWSTKYPNWPSRRFKKGMTC